jgi:peroxin-7
MRFVSYETQDGLYDLAWSEVHENQLVTASGDGSIKLWDVMLNVSIRPNSDSLP